MKIKREKKDIRVRMSTFNWSYKATMGGYDRLGILLPIRSNLTTLMTFKIISKSQF